MKTLSLAKIAGLATLIVFLSGCEHKEPPPPILSVPVAKECTAQVNTANAMALPFDPDGEAAIDLIIDDASNCYKQPDGAKALYSVVAIPQPGYEYILSVQSYVKGTSLFPPRLLLLDKSGKVLREFDRSRFQFRANILIGMLRAHPGDVYLVIGTDPLEVGKTESQVRGRTYGRGSGVYNSDGNILNLLLPLTLGAEVERDFTYTYGGRIKVVATAMKKAD